MPDPQEQDVFARAGITDADFADEPEIGSEPSPDVAEPSADDGQGDARPRDESGRFVAKEKAEPEPAEGPGPQAIEAASKTPETPPVDAPKGPDGIEEAPARFSPDAKAAWAASPPAIRGEVNRAIRELEQGIQAHQATVAPLKRYIDMAGGAEALAQAAQRYIGIEQQLAADPIKGLGVIANNLGTDLRTIAAHVLGQPAPDYSQEMGQLRQQLQQAHAEVQQYRQEREQRTASVVQDFWAQRPRADELQNEIKWALKTGLAQGATEAERLASAYEYAERLRPAPPTAAPAAPPPQQPHTPPANLSVDGSPGSAPGYTPPPDRRQNIADRLSQFGF
jgi:hypothetical protein